MLLVGIWAAQFGRHRGAAALTLPLAFVLSATGGLLAGLAGLALPLTEQAVVASLLVLGLLLAFAAQPPLAAAAALCALFGFFHGLAHGAELHGSAWTTAAGMASATALLHAAGFAVARAAGARSALLARLSGGAVGVVGLALAVRLAA
ncbi:MAG: HupE/UreJ family protein [Burkholderiaceae bacterium]|nr:HupE/UreJ family protein [Burkholderiaceae bacterium]